MATMRKFVVTSVTKDSPGAGQVTIVGTYTDTDVSVVPSVQVTVPNYTDENLSWSRINRLNELNLLIMRNGVTGVALELASLNKIAYTLQTGLTFAPTVQTQPSAQSSNHSGGSATFTVDFGSELSATYQWQESSDGSSWSNISNGGIYAGATTQSLVITPTDTSKTGYYYRCRGTNSLGTTNSNSAVLTVT